MIPRVLLSTLAGGCYGVELSLLALELGGALAAAVLLIGFGGMTLLAVWFATVAR